MKKLILYGLFGVLFFLFAQDPVSVQAMDNGAAGSAGYRGYARSRSPCRCSSALAISSKVFAS